MLNLKSKKGLEAKILIGFILTLVGFAIILIAFWKVPWEKHTDIEACHLSVISKMTLPDTAIKSGKDIVPLNCKTQKICVTSKILGRGDCKNVFGDDFITVKLKGSPEEKQEQIKKILADEIAEMWYVMGQGKGQIFAREMKLKKTNKKCVIYSRIYFDDTVLKDLTEINDFNRYLTENKVPNSEETYFHYLYGSDSKENYDPSKDKFSISGNSREKAIIFVEAGSTTAIKNLYAIIMAAGTGAIGGSIFGPFGFVAGAISGALVGYSSGEKLTDAYINKNFGGKPYSSSYIIINYNSQTLKNLNCDSFENLG